MSSSLLPSKAQRVQDFLRYHGMDTAVVQVASSARTAQEAAEAIECQVEQIVKSLIFKKKPSGEPVLFLVSGRNRLCEKKIKEHLKADIEKAEADFTLQVTGFVIGGIPPFAHLKPLSTYIDEDLLAFETVWAAAGTSHTVFQISPQQLINLTRGTILSLKRT